MTVIVGRKVGMTQVFDDQGNIVPVTVVEAGPCVVTQVRTPATDGYAAVQLGFEAAVERKVNKPLALDLGGMLAMSILLDLFLVFSDVILLLTADTEAREAAYMLLTGSFSTYFVFVEILMGALVPVALLMAPFTSKRLVPVGIAAFLAMAVASGLTCAITNPIEESIRKAILAADVFLGRDENCQAWLAAHRASDDGGVDPRAARRERRRARDGAN